ncbi:SCO2400 family protein [Streptomyces sp. NPDC055722]
MDYCSSCRRHLNGALVCPGCGAYAPDIAPVTRYDRPVPARATTTPAAPAVNWDLSALETGYGEHPHEEDASEATADDAADGGYTGAPQGRAARRRQRARWKKNQRRAVVATAVALVGGGLTLASMDRHSGDRAQAAPAPDVTSMGGTDGQATDGAQLPSTQVEPRRSAPTSPAHSSPAAGLPAHRSAAPQPATTAQGIRPDAAAVPRTILATPTMAPSSLPTTQSQSSGSTVTLPDHTPAPQSTPTTPAPAHGTGSGATQPTPAPTATSPSHLCLLVLCLG